MDSRCDLFRACVAAIRDLVNAGVVISANPGVVMSENPGVVISANHRASTEAVRCTERLIRKSSNNRNKPAKPPNDAPVQPKSTRP